ncbi:MAG: sigma 54-interacting transcriptional regulator [Bernardetiaceae bacterium]|nr:sigma 54-interacting transcriptional regulator [Bernardetiaceae bacterium]
MQKSEQLLAITTLGGLKQAAYATQSVKQELRANLIEKLKKKEEPFPGIYGYEETVLPDVQRAILSMHNINLLGLRGQAKTRIARLMVGLLDEYVPYISGSEINDDPFRPISKYGIDTIAEKGDDTPISWWHRSERYTEKLATPDVSVADLIGDVDPIKAANMKLSYSDERVLNFGLIPRSHRGIFVINELPDLQARIQVALFNILQEGDIQIRGFKLRLPLDIQFVFTANPEDYTNRGSIVTPLKDRIGSQIITHYPREVAISKKITLQEVRLSTWQKENITIFDLAHDLVEQVAFEARKSEYIDEKSGVSARLTISAYENLASAAERRALIQGEAKTAVRIADFVGVLPAIAGKVELVYEGEQEGANIVAQSLINKSIRKSFIDIFPDPEKEKKKTKGNLYKKILKWFEEGHEVDILHDASEADYRAALDSVPDLLHIVLEKVDIESEVHKYFMMEFVLHGLAEYSVLSKDILSHGLVFKDLFSSMFSGLPDDLDEDEDDDNDVSGYKF